MNDAAGERPHKGLLGRIGGAIKSTLSYDLGDLLRRRPVLDASTIDEVETLLLCADVGVGATARITADLSTRLARRSLADPQALRAALQATMLEILAPVARPLQIPIPGPRPFVMLVVGVNGTGKTTTIGKLAAQYRAQGRSVLLAAGDTFRAAAVEQLEAWGARAQVPVVAQHPGADSASVVYDALESARARKIDVMIADTAGRLHTQQDLMEELKKVRRVLGKLDPHAPHETLLVLDGTTGQNAIVQARQFHGALGVTGLALTKLDGTAKGGVVFALAEELGIPVRFVGLGEGADDLHAFDAGEFVAALLAAPRQPD